MNRLSWFMTHALNACVPCVHLIAVSTLDRHPIDNSLAAVDKFSPEWQRCARHVTCDIWLSSVFNVLFFRQLQHVNVENYFYCWTSSPKWQKKLKIFLRKLQSISTQVKRLSWHNFFLKQINRAWRRQSAAFWNWKKKGNFHRLTVCWFGLGLNNSFWLRLVFILASTTQSPAAKLATSAINFVKRRRRMLA